MYITINAKNILFVPIGTLLAFCLLSTFGCGGGSISEVHTQDLLQRVKIAETAKTEAESELKKTLERVRTAESAKRRAESDKTEAESELKKTLERVRTAESDKRRAESELKKTLERVRTAESDKRRAESELNKALERVRAAESDKRRAESKRDTAIQRAKIAEEEKKNLEKLVNLVPQAAIKNVRTDLKKKRMDITVTFSIKNRKDVEGSVYVYFYFQDGDKLRDRKNNHISISQNFTPKRVTDTQTVELPSMSYDKLNTSQPSELKFYVHIYDKPTNSFLDKEPYSVSFSFEPHKDNPVQLTGR